MANSCKFQKTQYQVSYDSGATWEDVVPTQFAKGELIEYDSPDCTSMETLYRWRTLEGQYLCDGNKMYVKEIQEESYNNGITWYVSYPTAYRGGEYVGEDAEFCCDKFVGHYIYVDPSTSCGSGYYWDGVRCVRNSSSSSSGTNYKPRPGTHGKLDPLKVIKCDGKSSLTSADTKYYTNDYYLFSAEIGDSVSSIGTSAFSNTMLETIVIPSGVTIIGNSAFRSCSSLTSCTIGSGVTSIGVNAFYRCSGLTTITANAITPPTLGTSAFDNTSSNLKIYVPCESIELYINSWSSYASRIEPIPPCEKQLYKYSATYSNGSTNIEKCNGDTILRKGEVSKSGLVSVDIGGACVTRIGTSAFTNYTSLTTVNISNGVTTIGEEAFYNCTSLSSVTIPNSVTSIERWAFNYCTGLTSVNIPTGVTNITDRLFYYCWNLTSIDIPNSVTSIGMGAFYGCSSLTNIDIPNSVTWIGNSAFNSCSGLASIVIPSSVTSIGVNAFYRCSGLTTITANAITPPTLGTSAFDSTNNCPIYVPAESVQTYKSASGWSSYRSRIQAIT